MTIRLFTTGLRWSAMLLTLAGGWANVSSAQQFNDLHRGGSINEPKWEQLAFCSDCNSGGAYVSDDYGSAYGDAPGCCDDGCCGSCDLECCDTGCCDPCTPPWAHRTGVWGTFLYLHATGADMHHAQQQNGTGGAGTTPFGLIGVTDPDHEPGFRVGGQVACDMCTSVAVNYTFFESSAIDSLDIPANVGGGLGTVGSLVHHPAADITSSAGPVNADYDLKMQLLDADYRRLFRASNCGWMNYFVGARYGRLEQDFRQLGTFGGSQGGVIDTTTQIDFDGTGLRVGLDGERILGHGCFSAYGNLSASALVGSFRGDYRMNNATTVSDLAIVRWEDDRVAPMLEYEVGLAWTSCSGCWRAKIGYTAIHWFNVATTPDFVDAVQADNYVDIGDTLSFSGLTSSVEWRF
ncbi:Lpg1974 family pore-forming outer membrane protein [Aeoliella sp. ICT_H6.2]|uniref:Lpg1974 family pore-forming outer membrane protein n=1 Tax=Aeoliella straminimaris TaxID=2954799 RepID=A0A9X2FHE3_9BACT|nr:Lpg1974 family pore-forming outer membrane protein [Aeoliella straminimaris]MCO6044791.1 Lpg1974 family pore-forming outer membrane protein [Aeoliella straminimaris]